MPIRPQYRWLYPIDWPQLSAMIRFERAKGRCECRGECGATPHDADAGGRCTAVHDQPHPLTGSNVVLTTAHRDHTPENVDPANLRAYCNRCHLSHDAKEHRRNASHTRAMRAAGDAPPLFPEPPRGTPS